MAAISIILRRDTCGWYPGSLAIFIFLKQCDRKIGDQELSALIEKTEVSKWLWAAFGPGEENHLLTYLDKDGNPQGCKDPSIPL